MSAPQNVSRRGFLRASAAAAGGVLIGFQLGSQESSPAASSKLNAFVHVGKDDIVTLFIHKAEMGQGTVTSLSMLLAEELECDWKKIRTEFAGVNREYGAMQGVFGSASVRSSFDSLRRAGAAAREMLVQAAAQVWHVDPSVCRAENGAVINTATADWMTYGSLSEDASKLAVPANPPLKDPAQFRLIGKPVKRLDTPPKVDGSAQFGIDVRRPGMVYAVVARCPVFGGKVKSFDAAKAKAVPGVKLVVQISGGVAVVADNTWSAMQGRRVLDVQWDEGPVAAMSTPALTKIFQERMRQPGAEARKEGDAPAALAAAARKIEADYEVPFLAHAPMEPLNCTADVSGDRCTVWASTQGQSAARAIAARITGLPPEKVEVHTLYMGGGFGRRAAADYIGEAVEVSKAVGAPVKLTWSREDDGLCASLCVLGPVDHGFDYYFGIPASLDMDPYVYIENDRAVEQPTAHTEGQATARRLLAGGGIAPGFEFPTCCRRSPTGLWTRSRERAKHRNSPSSSIWRSAVRIRPGYPSPSSKASRRREFTATSWRKWTIRWAGDCARSDEAKVTDNTLVIFTSDNGADWKPEDKEKFAHRANANWKGEKADIWDAGHRIPFLARWPGKISGGRQSATNWAA